MNNFRTHIDSSDIEKINEFYHEDFYSSKTLLIMERSLSLDFEGATEFPEGFHVEKLSRGSDLKAYLKANSKAFSEKNIRETISERLSKPEATIYVLLLKNKVVSSVMAFELNPETIATESIFTVKEFRKRGFARNLLNQVLMEAKEKGKTKAQLSVYSDDCEAIKLYLKTKYRITRVLQEFTHE